MFFSHRSSAHGILEFNTEKAGQDVTPLNLEFNGPKQKGSAFNSITGKCFTTLQLFVQNIPYSFIKSSKRKIAS